MTVADATRTKLARRDKQGSVTSAKGTVIIIDDQPEVLRALTRQLSFEGYRCESYASADQYLAIHGTDSAIPRQGLHCVLCDVRMPGTDGLMFQKILNRTQAMPLLLMSGYSRPEQVVEAFHGNVVDFLIKPIESDQLLAAVDKAMAVCRRQCAERLSLEAARERIASLSDQEKRVISCVAKGILNRVIADTFDVSIRTVKYQRQRAMEKLGLETVVELGRFTTQFADEFTCVGLIAGAFEREDESHV